MTGWFRNSENHRLVRCEPDPDLEPELEPKLELEEVAQEETLSDIFYPPMTAFPSYFTIPKLGSNVSFELRPHYIQMLHKFTGLEDTYLFLREFEEACSIMHFPNIPNDIVRIKLIPFALKDSSKHWMYGWTANSVTPWNDFVRLFLRNVETIMCIVLMITTQMYQSICYHAMFE